MVHWDPIVVSILPCSPDPVHVVAAAEQRCCRGIAPNAASTLHIVPICPKPGARKTDISTALALTSSLSV